MERVTLRTNNASVLHHQLDAGIERKHNQLCAIAHQGVVRRGTSVIKWEGGIVGEVGGVDAVGLPKEVGLEEGCGWLNEWDVDRSCKFSAIRPLAGLVIRARAGAKAHSEEEAFIDFLWDISRELSIC